MFADLRFAWRQFARSPLFAAAVVLVLGLGVGASTAVFTLVDAYLLKPLPFPEPERVVAVWRGRGADPSRRPLAAADFLYLREQTTSLSHLAALEPVGVNLTGGVAPGGAGGAGAGFELGSRVTGDFFPLLGVDAALGRAFGADEDRPGREQVVVLSDALWRQRFGADPGVVGRTVALDGRPHRVVGVMPPTFRLATDLGSSERARFWVPAALTPGGAAERAVASWNLVGRVRAGAPLAAAGAEVMAVAKRLEAARPDTSAGKTFFLVGLQRQLAEGVRPALTMLFAATLLLLAIASANVALLLLARASAREGEVAVRAALGASRPRLVRQFLAESLALALAGGLVGYGLAFAGVDVAAAGYAGAALAAHEARPDGRVLAFALLLASLAGLGAGLVPAWRASGARLHELLKEGAARATAGGRRRRAQAALLVAEVALSAVLLAGSSAVARGFSEALNEPWGFSPAGALTFSLHLPEARYGDAASSGALRAALLDRLRALPGVTAAGAGDSIPLGGFSTTAGFEIEGGPQPAPGGGPWATYQHADGDYFGAMGVPLRRGRAFAAGDREGGAPVMIVSDAFARAHLPGADPLGRRVRWGGEGPWREVVGVVGDVRYAPTGAADAPPTVYVPFRQADGVPGRGFAFFVVRTAGDPRALANAARAAVYALDADLPVADVETYDERASDSLADRRFTLALVSSFAASALLLTALGLFGLVSYQTRRRSRELAIRMALGAASADVRRLVLRDTARLLIAGLALGLPAAFLAGRLLAAKLEGVPPADPLSLAATALVLGAVAFAAAAAPARRAAKTSPARVLRAD